MQHSTMTRGGNRSIARNQYRRLAGAALLAAAGLAPMARAATPAQLLAQYSAQAGGAAAPARGQQ